MKKIMFIMMMAVTFIPITHIAASNGEISSEFKSDIVNSFAVEQNDYEQSETGLTNSTQDAQKIKRLNRVREISGLRKKMAERKISDEKRDRLLGLLLLAHGGRR